MVAGRRPLRLLSTFPLLILLAHLVFGQVTVYSDIPLYQQRALEAANASGIDSAPAQVPGAPPTLPAYDQTRLIPPALPQPLPATTFTLELPRDAAQMQGLSIPHVGGGFFGFSIEMSVLSQVGKSVWFFKSSYCSTSIRSWEKLVSAFGKTNKEYF